MQRDLSSQENVNTRKLTRVNDLQLESCFRHSSILLVRGKIHHAGDYALDMLHDL